MALNAEYINQRGNDPMRYFFWILILFGWYLVSSLAAHPCFAKSPQVAKSVPENGDINVDPNLREIRITFDQAMSPRGQSVVGGGDSFPELLGKNPGKWRGSRTFALRVKLKPNHDYRLSFNNQTFKNFRNRQGESAIPYPLQFRTAGDKNLPGEDETTGSANKAAVDQLMEAVVTQYSHRDRLDINWPAVFESNRKRLEAARSPREFAQLAAKLMSKAQDKHLLLKYGEEIIPSYVNPVTPNVNFRQLPQLIPNWKQHSPVLASGRWEDGVAYLWIGSWSRGKIRELAPIFDVIKKFQDSPALIIDVRGNGGGDERIARSVAGCFIDKPTVYAKHVVVDLDESSGFSTPHERIVAPNAERAAYRGKLAVLSGPVVMSSCEAFLLMMKQVPGTVLVGAASQGYSGNPQPVELDNGVVALLPCWKAMTVDGIEFEGIGIEPDISVSASREILEREDPVIDAALAHLRK